MSTLTEKNSLKIHNISRNNEDSQKCYLNSSVIPHIKKRNTDISSDNIVLKGSLTNTNIDMR